jgi:hypothetical protein
MLGVFGNVESKGAVRALVQEPVEAVKPSARTSLASAFSAIGAPTRMALGDVLQHIRQREQLGATGIPMDPWRLNEQLLAVVTACHGLDVARRQLLNALNTRKKLENVSHIVGARVAAGLSGSAEQQQLAELLTTSSRLVEVTSEAWETASRHFTRLTRFLPSQLVDGVEGFVPVDPAEVDRLAQASLLACPNTQAQLKQLALEGARRRDASPDLVAPTADELSAWIFRLHQARAQAVSRFSQARESYLQAEMAWGLAKTRVKGARSARQIAEAQFRVGVRGVAEFAQALIDLVQLRNDFLQRESDACVARSAMYAMALQLPEQFGLR